MGRLSLAIPSRGNPDGLRRCVNSALALAHDSFDLYIHFSDDDAGYRFCPSWPNLTKLRSESRQFYYAEANRLFHELPDGPFVWVDDDCEFVKRDWDALLQTTLFSVFEDGYGVLEFFPGAMKHFISHASLFEIFYANDLYPSGFIHFCGDSARAHDVQQRGLFRSLNVDDPADLIITHPMAANYSPGMRAMREMFWEQDRAALEEYVR